MFGRRKQGSFGSRAALPLVLLLSASCATLTVPPQVPRFDSGEMKHVAAHGIDLAVKPIEGRDSYWALFDDNLPEAGLAAIWMSVRNDNNAPVDFSKVRWVFRRGTKDLKPLDGDQVFKLYYRARRIRMYQVQADRQARLALERVRFQPGRVRPSTAREGFVFFRVDPNPSGAGIGRGALLAEGIRLSDGRPASLRLDLDYANP